MVLPLILGAGLLYGIAKASNASQAAERLSYTLKEVKLSMSKGRILARIDIWVNNPTRERLRFKDFSGTLYADSQKVGDVQIANPVDLPPKVTTPISLQAFITPTSVITLIFSALAKGSLPSKGYLKGTLRIGALQLPVDEEFMFNEPQQTKK